MWVKRRKFLQIKHFSTIVDKKESKYVKDGSILFCNRTVTEVNVSLRHFDRPNWLVYLLQNNVILVRIEAPKVLTDTLRLQGCKSRTLHPSCLISAAKVSVGLIRTNTAFEANQDEKI